MVRRHALSQAGSARNMCIICIDVLKFVYTDETCNLGVDACWYGLLVLLHCLHRKNAYVSFTFVQQFPPSHSPECQAGQPQLFPSSHSHSCCGLLCSRAWHNMRVHVRIFGVVPRARESHACLPLYGGQILLHYAPVPEISGRRSACNIMVAVLCSRCILETNNTPRRGVGRGLPKEHAFSWTTVPKPCCPLAKHSSPATWTPPLTASNRLLSVRIFVPSEVL